MVLGNFFSGNIRTFGKTKLFPSGSDIKCIILHLRQSFLSFLFFPKNKAAF